VHRVPISALDAISPAFQHTKQQLLEPFRITQWARLALVGLLAGELSSGGGCGTHFPLPHAGRTTTHISATGLAAAHPLLLALAIGALVVLGLLLAVLFVYLNSMMRFILFDSVVEKDCQIRRGWRRRQEAGWRYFGWQILLFLASAVGLTILVGVPTALALALGWLKNPGDHVLGLVLGGILLFFLFCGSVVSLGVVAVLTKDFVVPQMAMEDIGAIEGWRRLLSMMNREKGGYAGYLGMKLVMAVGAAVIMSMVTLIVFLLILIPVGGIGVVAVLGGKAAGLTWNLYTITIAVVLGSMLAVAITFSRRATPRWPPCCTRPDPRPPRVHHRRPPRNRCPSVERLGSRAAPPGEAVAWTAPRGRSSRV
jgi:hypothetical protein